MWDLFVGVVCERESMKTQGKVQSKEDFAGSSQEAFLQSEACDQHMTEMRRVITTSFHECLAGKAFPRDTRKTLYFVNLSYLIHPVPNHTIYTHITHRY